MKTEEKKQSAADHVGVPFLRGERVTLRTISPADVPLLYRWVNDPDVCYTLRRGDTPMGWQDEVEWAERSLRASESRINLMLEVPEHGPIGTMGLDINWPDRSGSTGTMIGVKEAWGKGFATEAKMVLLNHAFNRLNLWKVWTHVFGYNERSLRCQKRCGYVEVARYPEDVFRDGRYHDTFTLMATRETFEAAHAAWRATREAAKAPA